MSALAVCILASMFLPVFGEDPEKPDVDRPLVAFTPDWRTMFYNETLTIFCLHPSNAQENETYIWYRNNIPMDITQQNFTISSIQLYDRANYQCQTRTSAISDPIRPHVITDLSILRVPRYTFEDDILNITCDSRLDVNTTNAKVSFYKNYDLVKPMNYETYLFVGRVDRTVTGKHKCTKKAIFKNEVKESDAEEMLEVTELFTPPELKLSSYPVSVGMDVTMTCVTTLHPFRADTELQFAFYRNGWHVQGFGSSNKFLVQSVEVEDSGEYSCEVRTLMNSVRKISSQLLVLIQESVRPMLSVSPNWDKIMRFEQVTMTCDDKKSKRYLWYKDNVRMFSTGNTLRVYATSDKDIGHYQCQGESGEKSQPVHLDVFFVWLILQAPLSIHEGDTVTLKCKMWTSGKGVNTTFYKDDNMIQFLGSQDDLRLGTVSKNTTGKYKCTRYVDTGSISKTYIAEEYISVVELFSSPDIRLNLDPVVEGADMILTCHTSVSQLRQSISLKFAFYKNGKMVQDFSRSRKYKISSAQLEDSGSYVCEAKTLSNDVKKASKAVSITVQGMAVVSFIPNVGKILTAETITLTCKVDPKIKDEQEYYWYKDRSQLNISLQSITIQEALVSDSGYYQCRSTNTHMSEPVRLDVSNSDIVLQAPPFVLEGDNLNLTCHSRRGLNLRSTKFYKNSNLLKLLGSESVLSLGKAYTSMSGEYKCSSVSGPSSSYNTYSAELFVPVIEVFSYLAVKVKTSLTIEGYPISLSCDFALNPALNPLRGSTNLELAFYRGENRIREFGKSNSYEIKVARTTDSGNYTCKIQSSLIDEVKVSPKLEVIVQELFSTPVLTVSPTNIQSGKSLFVNCDFTLHPDKENINVKTALYKNGKALTKFKSSWFSRVDSGFSGDYMCEVSDPSRTIIKYSKAMNIVVEEQVSGVRLITDHDTNMLAGSNITLLCSVREGSSLSFTWMHNFKELNYSCATYQILHNGQMLFIESAQTYHSGSYKCKVSNHFSSSESNKMEFTIIEPIGGALLSTNKKVLDVVKEDSLTFTCFLTQGKGSYFFWIHNEQHLEQNTSIYEFQEGGKVLHIKSAQPHHEGSYQCVVEKDFSPKRRLVAQSGTLTLKISSKGGFYLKPLLIIMAVMAILFISFIVYKYQNKLVKPHFFQGKPENTRVPLENIGDKVLLVDNMENSERSPNSHH
ncbi:Fc receptor-like protein 5 [Dendropsophus ebraccatus]|uniref:Fc receptor-like protein 5 n=1 Tax=Dendropsophus ebraccatus TaxID=150705 RepID=UPI003831BC25